ncbi:glutathione S-transferase family protein [Shimia sp. MMG029]|uniref:glutathione S-transferase family protein n=1 Tax=Shimia sp. MMG029 TaxID=3021978 RepID=UPI0022FE9B9E|nr:glutathione S-transferase family protein [Shimia sp. MMG029]MDA5557848.1 glutathione S-transferase family protein [Shimia sp. MMG029]
MIIRLHHIPISRSFRVIWMLEELGLEAEIIEHSIRRGTMYTPEIQGVSPASRAPAVEIDGIPMIESGAILEYLAETHPEAGLGVAIGSPTRARYLQLMHFAETQAAQIEQLNMQHVFLRDPAMASVTTMKLNTKRLQLTMRALEGMLEESGYLLPTGFSAADIMFGLNLRLARYYVHLEDYPKVLAYRDRLIERPAYKAALAKDGEQEIYAQDFYHLPEGA